VAGTDPVLPGILAQPPCDVLVLPPAPRLGEEPVDRVASLSRLLDPRSVAVVAERGSPLRGTLGVRVSTAERRRRGGETLYSLDHPADLAVVSAAPAELRGAVGACVDAGVGAVAVMARGSEVPDDVARDVAQVCREAGIRLLGPGVEVLANLGEHVALHAGMSLGVGAGHGRVAVVTQGPGLTGLMRVLASHDLGADLVVDVGRAVDVGVAEVAAWAATRGRVPAVLVLSAVPCRQALEAELSQAGRPSVPVVLLERGGASPEQGSRGVAPRVLRAETVDELANLALLFVGQPAPTGRHVAFVTNEPWASHAGVNRQLAGAGLLGADLTQHAEQRSKLLAPGASLRGAVLSLTPDVTADSLSEVLTTVTEERGVDAVVVAQRAGPHLHRADVERVLGTLRRDQPDVVVVAVDQSRQHPWRSRVVPVFDSDRHALDALAGLIRA
jgi:acyl-CoA synthetase (NDP forming)